MHHVASNTGRAILMMLDALNFLLCEPHAHGALDLHNDVDLLHRVHSAIQGGTVRIEGRHNVPWVLIGVNPTATVAHP